MIERLIPLPKIVEAHIARREIIQEDVPGSFDRKFSSAAGDVINVGWRDRLTGPPGLDAYAPVVEENGWNSTQPKPERHFQTVMPVHHEKRVLLHRDRDSPAAGRGNETMNFINPARIGLLRWNQLMRGYKMKFHDISHLQLSYFTRIAPKT
ncbi:hypothetical protein GGD45_001518 [Rhizobium tropici]|uniref:Uncharacterized protein n=1 Tax=Rhizobium tropici TaxID=398 RepID=A0ABR6QW57_RHITR|nr:hypothetical protein [Rhizobium tropici]